MLRASARTPVPAKELAAQFSPAFIAGVGGTDKLNAVLGTLGPLRLAYTVRVSTTSAEAVTAGPRGRLVTVLGLGARGRIDLLQFTPRLAAPRSWREVDRGLRALAPRVSLDVGRVTHAGSCVPLHGIDARTSRPLGSAFKLYVLGALAREVAAGRLSWTQRLAIRQAWKSIPSGHLQNVRTGTTFTLRTFADYMISISDNTAADHLIHLLGRAELHRQLVLFGNSRPALTTPFPTTRELFTLKYFRHAELARIYLAVPRALRPALLDATAGVRRDSLVPVATPVEVNRLEWFGSATDMCRAMAGLWRQSHAPGLAPVGQALSINDGGLALNPATHPVVWFKGGSEPGVLTLTFLVRGRGGVRVVSALLEDPRHALDEASIVPRLLAIIRGASALGIAGR